MNQDPRSSGIRRLRQIPLKRRHVIPEFERRSNRGMESRSRLELANSCLVLGKNPLPRPLKKPLGCEVYRGLQFDRLYFHTPKELLHKRHTPGKSFTPQKIFQSLNQPRCCQMRTPTQAESLCDATLLSGVSSDRSKCFLAGVPCRHHRRTNRRLTDKLSFRFSDGRRYVKSGSLFFVHGQKA
jgi:hypothetical protein